MSGRLRVAVVGVGHLGRHHARLLASDPRVELVAVVDVDAGRAEQVARATGVAGLHDHRELLGKLDAVTIAVPTALHHALALEFLEAGHHTFVEKPLAANYRQGLELVEAARRRACVLSVGHSERFNPALKAARSVVTRPGFVEVHRLAPFDPRGTDVDVVLDLMIHDIDLVLHLLEREVRQVHAVGVPVLTEHVDIANARLEFAGGAVANLTASRVSRERMRKIRFFARDTYVSLDTGQRKVEAFRLERSADAPPRIQQLEVPVADSEPLEEELQSFCAAALGVSQALVSGEEALAALEVAERINQAIAQHEQQSGAGA